ncbi:MAG: multidrug effflux MFS transporter [Pseudomonadota bacterium]
MAAVSPEDLDNANGLPSGIRLREFIVLVALLTSLVAFSIDAMLPALPVIGSEYALASLNDQQWVIIAFVLAFGPSQLVFGPVSDAYGRRVVVILGGILFTIASFVAANANSFELLITARIFQGFGAGAVRVATNAIVRDCFAGREMARVMSFVFTVFILIPIIAPAIGELMMFISSWHLIFVVLGATGAALSIWYWFRLGETLPLTERRPLRMKPLWEATREILTNRIALGYTLAVTLFFGGLFAFIISIQQIVAVTYDLADWFAGIFAITATAIGIASLTNAGLVRKYGMRRISHIALISFAVFGIVLTLIALLTTPPFWLTMVFLAIIMGSFGLVAGNFNALAMEPLGHIAGAASSVLGTISFTGGAMLGTLSGQLFNGTILPLAASYAIYGSVALLLVFWTERGKLFSTAQ